jgi:hypothetical protein
MAARQYASYHPSISLKYTFVLEVKESLPSKHSYTTAQEAADIGLRQGLEKYGDKLMNVYVLEKDKAIGSWKPCTTT